MASPRRTMRRTLLLFATALVLGVAVAGLVRSVQEPAVREPGPPARSPDGVAASGPTGTPAPPAPEPPAGAVPTAAAADAGVVPDPSGDLADSEGLQPAAAVPGADLTGMAVTRAGDGLSVRWVLSGPPPSTADSLLWSVDTFVAGERVYTISVQLVGARLFSGVFDWRTGEQQGLDGGPTIDGNQVAVAVPTALVPALAGPFAWEGLSQLDGGFEDRIPQGDERIDVP